MLPDLSTVKKQAGEAIYQAGETLFERGGVREEAIEQMQLKYLVNDSPARHVTLDPTDEPCCTCETYVTQGICAHTVAALLRARSSGALNEMGHRIALRAAPKLLSSMTSIFPEKGGVHLALNFSVEQDHPLHIPKLRVGIRIGDERLYVVRSIPAFLRAMDSLEPIEFGKGFTYYPEWMHFGEKEMQILKVFRALIAANADANFEYKGLDARMIPLQDSYTDALMSRLTQMSFLLSTSTQTYSVRSVRHASIPLYFSVSGSLRGLTVYGTYPNGLLPLTSSCSYVLVGGNVIETDLTQRQIIRAMWEEHMNGGSRFEFPPKDTPTVIDELIPFLKTVGIVELTEDLERMLVRTPLKAYVYIDRVGKEITARTTFRYGKREIDPFVPQKEPVTMRRGELLLLRDAEAERKVLDCLGNSGFCMERGAVSLSGSQAIYQFITEGLSQLQKVAEVYMSHDFRKMTPRQLNLRGSMTLRGPHLELNFTDDDLPLEEVLPILEAIARKKRYFRLRDGNYLNLDHLEKWEQFARGIVDSAAQDKQDTDQLSDGQIELEGYRSFYMSSLLEDTDLPVERDESVNRLLEAVNQPEEEIILPSEIHLRDYQMFGVKWLRTLDRLHMGGILADDMGLGKTVQAIACMLSSYKPGEISLVVAPTSLTYNWQSELAVFAPSLRTQVVSGSTMQRMELFQQILENNQIDILITSYPLIRRDIEQMKDIHFHYIFLDEAQQIKNAASTGAIAVKQLKCETRFALTGTPMENHAGELWSIFDFVLPGYLGSRTSFLKQYSDGQNVDELRQKIRPFLLRRLKQDVLSELPDKMENIMTATMTPEQSKFYQASMMQLRGRVKKTLEEKGLGRGRMEVLSALTELRQICCHPALVANEYSGSSGKMEMLMDILPGIISAGRRVLIFSQFTTMLQIMEKQLQLSGYRIMYLDGHVPADERLDMAERFNAGEGEVFLISLKAGGTGLNLTGADVVIHYDPWWNPAAEEQATDRVYRIGQTKKVDVIRLVTHATIEEQVIELCKKKKELFDQLITPGEDLVTALTEEEIRGLFD